MRVKRRFGRLRGEHPSRRDSLRLFYPAPTSVKSEPVAVIPNVIHMNEEAKFQFSLAIAGGFLRRIPTKRRIPIPRARNCG